MAVLQAGEFPLWFQLTANGPVLLETIEDARLSAALIPWPLAPHIRFTLAQGDTILMAVNRDGFMRFSLWDGSQDKDDNKGIALYRFSGGEFWQNYTVSAFVLSGEKPAALLYLDDRFYDSDALFPSPRLWTFDRNAAAPLPLAMPALDAFAPEDGWDVDALRQGSDGQWYFRAVRKNAEQPEIQMLRSADLIQAGERVSRGAFQNAAMPLPLSNAPLPLGDMIAAVFTESGCGLITLVSPEFESARSFAMDQEQPALTGFYSGGTAASGAFLAATSLQGNAWYIKAEAASAPSVRSFTLPPLPEGFVYTGIGLVTDTVIAAWEEQNEYSIGAAGFMVIRVER